MKNLRSDSFFGSTKLWVFPILAWTLLVSVSLFWNLYSLRQNTLKTFTGEAQALAGVALSTVMWTAQHERVYVPLTEWIPPEPFFAHLPDREIVTPEGERFTQVSHALISRQVAEQAVLHGWDEKAIRLTSLQPLNPVNIPVEWEKAALQRLKAGQTENFALIGEGLKAQYTYMMPLRARQECLKCHHGHRDGDILGGLSVTEPAVSRLAMIRPQIVSISATHAGIFVTVAITILFFLTHLRRQWLNMEQLSSAQEKLIVKLAEGEAMLKEIAITDDLTGLKNRRGFFLFAEQQMKATNRQKSKLWFIFIDIDGMKTVNDKYGHSEGDKALTATAGILRDTFRESDIIARIGGDEFVVIIIGAVEINDYLIDVRLLKNLANHNITAKTPYRLSLSAGIVCCDPGESPCNIEELLKRADELMYERKRVKAHHCNT